MTPRSLRRRVVLLCVGLALASPSASGQAQTSTDRYRAVLDRYCVTCHNERLKTANLLLDRVNVQRVAADAEVWEKVVHKLQTREMPPIGRPRPDEATYEALASWLVTSLDEAADARPDPGRSAAVHRLNRAEYTNAVRDVLAVDIDGRSLLPADDASYGFDNIGDVLTMSQPLLERYLSAARRISRLAVGDATMGVVQETYAAAASFRQDDRMSEELPFGSRGGIAVRHDFPVDGNYSIRVDLQRTIMSGFIKGLGRFAGTTSHEMDVRVDGRLVERLTIQAEDIAEELVRAQLPPRQTLKNELVVRLPVTAGPHVVAVTFPRASMASEGFALPMPTRSYSHREEAGPLPAVDAVTIAGPYDVGGPGNSPSRQRIFVCRPTGTPDEDRCATTILSAAARRAYRRPVSAADVDPLRRAYERRRREGEDFEAGVRAALEAMLVNPRFLFRVERDPEDRPSGEIYRVSDLELASRLSFFLWSTIPDDELLDLAERGQLTAPGVLASQVTRMLEDRRSAALVSNFFGQWLYVRNLDQLQPDAELYPAFDNQLREAFRRETELFIDSQLREDHSVVDLLRAPYTFLNERLARLYGVPHVYGSHFRRVSLTDDRRAGLLGHGSILTVTSYANRTSPVVRGKFVLEQILGAPPPPPPPDVPSLDEGDGEAARPRTTRERLEQHRSNPVCATCHAKIDPLGFALENFDPIGEWRETDNGVPIDASGTAADGTTFDGPVEFRDALLHRQEQFVANVTRKLMTYALGRGLGSHDQPAVRQVMRAAAGDDYRWSSIIMGIVDSTPFRMRRVR